MPCKIHCNKLAVYRITHKIVKVCTAIELDRTIEGRVLGLQYLEDIAITYMQTFAQTHRVANGKTLDTVNAHRF